jgi:hypothetical protein
MIIGLRIMLKGMILKYDLSSKWVDNADRWRVDNTDRWRGDNIERCNLFLRKIDQTILITIDVLLQELRVYC